MAENPKRYLIGVILTVTVCCVLYCTAIYYQLGANVQAEWWVKDVYSYKEFIAGETPSPKIIILGGSNSLFGINSSIISGITGYPTLNLSSHAGLDISFHYYKLRESIGDGDIVVMPLEFNYYWKNELTEEFVNNILAWGGEDYLQNVNIADLVRFIVSIEPQRVFWGILHKSGRNPVVDLKTIKKHLNIVFAKGENRWRGYGYVSLSRWGDIVPGGKLLPRLKVQEEQESTTYIDTLHISERFVRWYNEIESLVRKMNGRLILTWPVTIRGESFDLSRGKYQQRVEKLRKELQKRSITVECNPALFNLGLNFFFNTYYHPNVRGVKIRSENLAEYCINPILLEDGKEGLSYAMAMDIVMRKESEFD